MSKGPWRHRPTVARRFIHIVQSAGLQIERIEFRPDGTFAIMPKVATTIEARPTENGRPNSFDEVLGRG
jgi:hypothetical protein